MSHRNGLHGLGALSCEDTIAVVMSLPLNCTRVAANCVSGGHMSASARAKWDPLADVECPHCG